MILLIVILLIMLIILGLPLFAGILAAALMGLYVEQVDFMAIPIEIFRLANAPVLLAIPEKEKGAGVARRKVRGEFLPRADNHFRQPRSSFSAKPAYYLVWIRFRHKH